MTFGTVAILGPGLLGGSLALALEERKLADRLVIYARSEACFPEISAKLPGAQLTTHVEAAVRGADVVVMCVPIEAMPALVEKFAGSLKPEVLVTDVGSVKGTVVETIEPMLSGRARWIGSHPMAGSERAGFSAANGDLFEGAAVIITPTPKTHLEAIRGARLFWEALGGNVIELDCRLHDHYVAQISHLPHLLAVELVHRAESEARALSGGGFRDTTRVASGSPELWAEILLANAAAVADNLKQVIGGLESLKAALENSDRGVAREMVLERLKAAHAARLTLPERPAKS